MSRLLLLLLLVGGVFGGWKAYEYHTRVLTAAELGEEALIAARYEEAAEWYLLAIEEDPEDLSLYLQLAECYYMRGDESLAAAQYRAAESLLEGEGGGLQVRQHRERYEVLRQKGY